MDLEEWLTRVDDEGFVCEHDGTRITDENHPVLDLCRRESWQCFAVSRDPYLGSVRGLRRTCEEATDNSNKAWSQTRRRVTGVPAEGAWGETALDCAKMLRSSIFHVWETVPARWEGQCESDYYVDLGIVCPGWQGYEGDITPRFFLIEADTFEAVKKKLELLKARATDPLVDTLYDFMYGGELRWLRAAGKERSEEYGSLRDHGTVSLMALTPREDQTFLETFDKMIEALMFAVIFNKDDCKTAMNRVQAERKAEAAAEK